MKTVTIGDIAKVAGVSKSTVSHVLSGKRPIGAEVTQRVMKIIEELNFKPSILARNLAEKKTNMIGFYGPSTKSLKEDVFFNCLISGVIDALSDKGYKLTYNPEKTDEKNQLLFDLDSSQPIDGAIIMNPRVGDDYLKKLKQENIPFVLIGRPSEDIDIFYVDNDNVASTYMAVNELISKGHHKIILMNNHESYTVSEDREKGYRLAYAECGIPVDESCIYHIDVLEEAGYRLCKQLIEDKKVFSAVFTCNDIIAVGVIRALREYKIKIPDKVAVIGEGDTLIAKVHTPTISSINLGTYDVGVAAANILVDVIMKKRIKGGGFIVPFTFVFRETT